MGQIIDDLLRLARIDRTELRLEDLDLSDLCATVVDSLALANPGPGPEVSIQPGLRLRADPDLLLVALENLLGNAWKFTSRRQGPAIQVGKRLSGQAEKTFFIQDNGAGFDMAEAGRLFNPFQRLHTATEFRGTGIGLTIVQRIIQRHGGRIWAEAEVGRGATFFFTLP